MNPRIILAVCILVVGIGLTVRAVLPRGAAQPESPPVVPKGFAAIEDQRVRPARGDASRLEDEFRAAIRERLSALQDAQPMTDAMRDDIARRAAARFAAALHKDGPSIEDVREMEGVAREVESSSPTLYERESKWAEIWHGAPFDLANLVVRWVPPSSSDKSWSYNAGAMSRSSIRPRYPWMDESRPSLDIALPVRVVPMRGGARIPAHLAFEYQYDEQTDTWRFINAWVYTENLGAVAPAM